MQMFSTLRVGFGGGDWHTHRLINIVLPRKLRLALIDHEECATETLNLKRKVVELNHIMMISPKAEDKVYGELLA